MAQCGQVPELKSRLPGNPAHSDRCWLTPEQKQRLRVVDGQFGLAAPSTEVVGG